MNPSIPLEAIAEFRRRFELEFGLKLMSSRPRVPFMMPSTLSLTDNFDETVKAIEDIRWFSLSRSAPLLLHFHHLRKLEPAAATMLIAEIYRANRLRNFRGGLVASSNPADLSIRQQFDELGFFRVARIEEMGPTLDAGVSANRPHYMAFRTLNKVHPNLAAAFVSRLTQAEPSLPDLLRNRMVAALKEAMANSNEHAYREKGDFEVLPGRWWLTGSYNPVDRLLTLGIADQGIGIPNTLDPTIGEHLFNAWRLGNVPDAELIAAATELHRTSTGRKGRGKGFQDMKQFINTTHDGLLRIWSNTGSYIYSKETPSKLSHKRSINGTLIEWSVRFRDK